MIVFEPENSFSDFKNRYLSIITKEIDDCEENYILNVGLQQYIDYLVKKYEIQFPEIDLDAKFAEVSFRDIPVSELRMSVPRWHENSTVEKKIITYYVPFNGDLKYLRIRPSQWTLNIGQDIQVDEESNSLIFEVICKSDNVDQINSDFTSQIDRFLRNYYQLHSDILSFSNSLREFIGDSLLQKKNSILESRELLNSLGVKIKKSKNTPNTFAIPKPKIRQKIVIKPITSDGLYAPEPTVDDETYREILKLIQDVGKNFETYPSTYKDKHEEDLRNHIIMILDPNFQNGGATAETFNKKGKTDIQIRYDSSVVFIAECKFWTGPKGFLTSIDQLLGYLTFRNSKAGLVIFVRNLQIQSVLNTIQEKVKEHKSYVATKDKTDISWFNYIFSLPGDRNKEIKLAIQVFHLP